MSWFLGAYNLIKTNNLFNISPEQNEQREFSLKWLGYTKDCRDNNGNTVSTDNFLKTWEKKLITALYWDLLPKDYVGKDIVFNFVEKSQKPQHQKYLFECISDGLCNKIDINDEVKSSVVSMLNFLLKKNDKDFLLLKVKEDHRYVWGLILVYAITTKDYTVANFLINAGAFTYHIDEKQLSEEIKTNYVEKQQKIATQLGWSETLSIKVGKQLKKISANDYLKELMEAFEVLRTFAVFRDHINFESAFLEINNLGRDEFFKNIEVGFTSYISEEDEDEFCQSVAFFLFSIKTLDTFQDYICQNKKSKKCWGKILLRAVDNLDEYARLDKKTPRLNVEYAKVVLFISKMEPIIYNNSAPQSNEISLEEYIKKLEEKVQLHDNTLLLKDIGFIDCFENFENFNYKKGEDLIKFSEN